MIVMVNDSGALILIMPPVGKGSKKGHRSKMEQDRYR
jgi:hypothetical protein